MELYVRDIDRTPLLSAAEEQRLAWEISQGNWEARDQLVRANLRLVVRIARRYTGAGLDIQDLIAEGNLGLVRAAEAFDAALNTRFSTYAVYWIHQSMRRALSNVARTVRIPAYAIELIRKWRRATTRLVQELGRTPTEEEVAASLKVSPKKLGIIHRALRIYNGQTEGEGADSEVSLDDLQPDAGPPCPGAAAALADELHLVLHHLDRLEERPATVLRLRYGLGGEAPLTLKDIGQRLGLTRERVRQIEVQALTNLRDMVEVA
jgi:RNA polymerase primary sigma factor